MKDEKKYLEIIERLENSINTLSKGFVALKEEVGKLNKKDLSKQFSMINLPSKGVYYPNKNKSLLIRYLTAVEEHILCDYFLMKSGKGIEMVLSELIIDDINAKNLLLSDFQAILIFLRSNAFGDNVDITPNCPHCGKENQTQFQLSALEFKTPKMQPNDDGKYVIFLEDLNMEFVISPITLAKELEKFENEDDGDYFTVKDEEGFSTKIRKEKSLSLVYNIDSINGIESKPQIKKIIRNIPRKFVDVITEFIKENEVGINEMIKLNCEFCGEEFEQKVLVGYDFLSLPESYKQNIYEEEFLLSYYGKAITLESAERIPTHQRKFLINRIKQEIDKQNSAEKQAMAKAKASKGKI